MKLKTKEAIEYLENKKEEYEWEFYRSHTKAARSLAQNNTWYLLFSVISKYQWYPVDEIKLFFLMACFWEKELIMYWAKSRIPAVWHIHNLTKEQGIFLIDTVLEYIKKHDIPFTLQTKDLQSLYDSYN